MFKNYGKSNTTNGDQKYLRKNGKRLFPNDESNRQNLHDYFAAEKKASVSFARRENDPNPFYQARRDCAHDEESWIVITNQRTLETRLEDNMKAMLKSELAAAAGVSRETFRRWLLSDADYLRSIGVRPNARILPPKAVKYLIDKYCIDL